MASMLTRLLFAIFVGAALLGAPAAQAAAAVSCNTAATGMTAHQSSSDGIPAAAPCNDKMPGCSGMLGCGVGASLPARTVALADKQVWTPAAYWPVAEWLEGLSVKPDLGPPITI